MRKEGWEALGRRGMRVRKSLGGEEGGRGRVSEERKESVEEFGRRGRRVSGMIWKEREREQRVREFRESGEKG